MATPLERLCENRVIAVLQLDPTLALQPIRAWDNKAEFTEAGKPIWTVEAKTGEELAYGTGAYRVRVSIDIIGKDRHEDLSPLVKRVVFALLRGGEPGGAKDNITNNELFCWAVEAEGVEGDANQTTQQIRVSVSLVCVDLRPDPEAPAESSPYIGVGGRYIGEV